MFGRKSVANATSEEHRDWYGKLLADRAAKDATHRQWRAEHPEEAAEDDRRYAIRTWRFTEEVF